ncbi:unnamed protein product [Oncorhynchus mykiss]|uniref:Uncharacterized protein n=1 Tax=Oncorhynchus mykiss TaxID=8022 RepID=A0A060XKD9_ONCMY|nr:unnamed protein product [Oncorhynchus mykiss]
MINSLKNKAQDEYLPVLNVKKPRKAEVNYCPQHPKGETTENNDRIVTEGNKFFKDSPWLQTSKPDVQLCSLRKKCVAFEFLCFQMNEFMRISTAPLLSTLFVELNRVLSTHGGDLSTQRFGRKMRHLMVAMSKDDTIHTRRACVLKSLCIYLNEDHEKLVKEYMTSSPTLPWSKLVCHTEGGSGAWR